MDIFLDDYSSNLMYEIDPNFTNSISQSITSVHPSYKFSAIKITSPSFIVAIGKNALVQTKSILENNSDFVEGIRVHQIEGYTDISLEGYSEDIIYLPHPFPNEMTVDESKKTLDILLNLDHSINIYFLISGGGSAAFCIPEEEINLENYLEIMRLGIASGYNIHELNLIRSLIDKVKGGKTGLLLSDYNVYAYITSDVIDDDPRVIASGPLNPGIEKTPGIINWLSRLFLSLQISIDIDDIVKRLPDNKKLTNVTAELLVTRSNLLQELQVHIEELGFQVFIADTNLDGNVFEVTQQVSQIMEQFSPFRKRVIIWSGEPTITLNSQALDSGKGGRISSLCVLISEHIKEENIYFLGIATDGQDGSSPAAGYIINYQTHSLLQNMGGSHEIVKSGNSGIALTSTGHGIQLENTDVNLLDIYLLIID